MDNQRVPIAIWTIADSRTGERATVMTYPNRASAERQIEAWRERDRRGRRTDVHEMMPYLVPLRVNPPP